MEGSGLGFFTKIRLKLQARYKRMRIDFYGQSFTLSDAPSFVSMYEEIFIKNIYDFRCIDDSPLVIDCGANVGLSIIYFKKKYPNAKIIAFEPDNQIFSILNENIKNQRLAQVELHQKAIWTDNELLTFYSQGGLSGHIRIEEREVELDEIKVQAFRLKDILNQRIDLLKIDIEGAEYQVLKDCKNSLSQVKNLFVEYHSIYNEQQRLDEVLKIISEAGFRYHIHEAYTSRQPFLNVKKMIDMDLQLNIFCYRN